MAPPGPPALPRHSAVLGLTLFTAIALPISGTASFLDWLIRLGAHDPVGAFFILITFGAPFLFGLAVAAGGLLIRDHRLAAGVIQIPLAFTHATMVLQALELLQVPGVPLRLSFVGFSLVSTAYYLYAQAHAEASDRPLGPRWFARWGAVIVTGTTLWLEFQTLRGQPLGLAVDVALASAVLLAVTLPPAPART
ncbi:MAG TPA: hypothetical protein VIK91_08060 [Nannocystis sp.]